MVGAPNRVLKRTMLGHEADGVLKVGVGRLAALERAAPELALGVAPAAEREHHRQCDLSFAEIVADILAELLRGAAVVERVIDELEGDAEVIDERTAHGLFVPA